MLGSYGMGMLHQKSEQGAREGASLFKNTSSKPRTKILMTLQVTTLFDIYLNLF